MLGPRGQQQLVNGDYQHHLFWIPCTSPACNILRFRCTVFAGTLILSVTLSGAYAISQPDKSLAAQPYNTRVTSLRDTQMLTYVQMEILNSSLEAYHANR